MLAWYVSLKSWIQDTVALADSAQSPSRSSIPGSVIPSPLQSPPFLRKNCACAVPELESSCAKWYAPRIRPASVAPP